MVIIHRLLLLVLVAFPLVTAKAQQVPDPRLVTPYIQLLQAQIAFQEALIKADKVDAEAQKATLWEWLIEAKKDASNKP